MKNFANGMGASSGGALVVSKNYNCTGDVWYVDFTSGVDAASPAGLSRYNPLKTIAQAVTNAANADDIVFLPNHAETLTVVQTISKALRFHSEGTGAARARFTRNAAAAILFNCTVARIQFRDIYFVAGAQANTNARVQVAGADSLVKDCYFECGAFDTGPAMDVVTGGDHLRVEGTTFISTSITTAPSQGLRFVNALTDMTLDGVIFDGGTKGWSSQFALDMANAATTNLQASNLSLLRDSDVRLNSGSSGFIQVGTASGSARIVHL